MEEKTICCCGVSRWIKSIGWFELIFALCQIILLVIGLVNFPSWKFDERTVVALILQFHGAKIHTWSEEDIYFHGWSMTFQNVIDAFMALLLLRASYKGQQKLLKVWLLLRLLILSIWLILIVKDAWMGHEGEERQTWMIAVLFTISVEMFIIWVVVLGLRDMKNSQLRNFPALNADEEDSF